MSLFRLFCCFDPLYLLKRFAFVEFTLEVKRLLAGYLICIPSVVCVSEVYVMIMCINLTKFFFKKYTNKACFVCFKIELVKTHKLQKRCDL